jgi:LysM repeat protein
MMKKHLFHPVFFCLVLILNIFTVTSLVYGGEESAAIKSIEFINTDLRDIFRSLAEIGKFTVVIDQTVHGDVTVTLKDGVSAKEAVAIVANSNGYKCKWQQNSTAVMIGSSEILVENSGSKNSKVFSLKFAEATLVAEALAVVIPKERITANSKANQITVVASEAELQNVTEIIARLDRKMPPINVELRMVEVTSGFLKEIGVESNPAPDVVGVALLSVQQSRLLADGAKASLLAKSNLAGLDSQEGKIFIGDKIPIVIEKDQESEIAYKIQYFDIGTKLTLIPWINLDNKLNVRVKTEVNLIANKTTTAHNWIPYARSREVESLVRLEEGQNFIVSGLLQRSEYEKMKDSPYVYPNLGELFRKGNPKLPANARSQIIFLVIPQPVGKIDLTATSSEKNKDKTTSINNTPTVTVSNNPPTSSNPNLAETPASTADANNPVLVTTGNENPATQPETTGTVPSLPEDKPVADEVKSEVTMDTNETGEKPSVISKDDTINNEQTLTETKSDQDLPPGLQKDETIGTGTESTKDPTVTVTNDTNPAKEKTGPVAVKENKGELNTEPAAVKDGKTSATGKTVKDIQYTVKKGDTLTKIARKFGCDLQSIIQKNKFGNTGLLKVKTILIIPVSGERIYTIKPKETLWRIAKRYGTTMEVLKDLNGILDETKVKAGQDLVLPTLAKTIVNPQF